MRASQVSRYYGNAQVSGYEEDDNTGKMILAAFSVVGLASGAYHGYKRNNSVAWAAWWGLCGSVIPVFTVAVAVAQGFGKPAQ
jgi:hypothetical protein